MVRVIEDHLKGVVSGDNLPERPSEAVAERSYGSARFKGGVKGFLEVLYADQLTESRAIRAARHNSDIDQMKPTASYCIGRQAP